MRLLGSLLLGLGAVMLAGCGKGGIQSPDFTSVLDSITVSPATANVDAGETVTFTAVGNYTTPPGSDTPTVPRDIDVSWTSSDTSIATIDASGVATGVGNGVVTITARAHGKQGTATLTAFASTLVPDTLRISPTSATQPAGLAQQYRAFGTFTTSAGPTEEREVTTEVTWSVTNALTESSPEPVAVIDAATGVATGLRQGSAVVHAALSGDTADADFIVTAPILVELDVTPDDPSVPLGATQAFRSVGVYSNGTTQPLESTWSSSNPGVATVTPDLAVNKVAQTVAEGTTTITATYDVPGSPNDLTGTSDLTVTAAALTEFLRVDPQLGRVTIGRQQEFTAIGLYSDGTEHTLPDSDVTWSIANAPGGGVDPVASIDSDGVASGLVLGVAIVTATLNDPGSVSGSATQTARLTVTDRVCTTPLLASESATAEGEVSATCAGCTVANPGNVINSDPDDFANISVPLALLGANAGVRVDANDNGSYTLPFAAGNNAGFVVSKPAGTLLVAELFSQIQVSTLLGDTVQEQTGTINPLRVELLGQEVTNGVLYDTALVSIFTSNAYDAIRLTFNSGTATAMSNVLVSQACGTLDLPEPPSALVRIERIVPAAPTVLAGASVGLVAIGTYSDGTTSVESPISDADLNWSSGDTAVATVDSNGVATGVAEGTAVVTAALKDNVPSTSQGRDATTNVTVLPSACQTAFLASEGATVTAGLTPTCLVCSVTDLPNVIDASLTTGARIGVNLGLLNGSAFITVTQDATLDPQPAGQPTGFLIGRPTGTVVLAEVLSQISVSVLRNGAVVESSSPTIPLRLDLLGTQAVAMDDFGLVTITPTVPYDAIRITFNSGLLSAGLQNDVTNLKVFQACEAANVIAASKKSMIPQRLH